MALTEKKKKSNKRSQDKNNKRFGIIMKKSEGETLEKYLKDNSYTVNGFIVQAVKEKIERDTGKNFDEFLQEQEPQELRRSAPSTAPSAISPEPAAPDEPAKPPEVNKGNQ